MTDDTIDSIAQALTAVPPRAVDPDVLAAADAESLAAALRRAVADLPANEQRARLAAAFAAMTPTAPVPSRMGAPTAGDLEAELRGPAPTFATRGGDAPRISTATAGLLSLRPFNAVKAAALAGVAVVALLAGVLAATATDDASSEPVAVPGSVTDPIPVLRPAAFGAEVPSDEQVAAMLPPDPAAQVAAAEAAAAVDAEAFEDAGIDPGDTAYVPDPDVDPYITGYTDGSGGDPDLPSPGDVVAEGGPAVGEPRPTGPSGGADGSSGGGTDGPGTAGGEDPGVGRPGVGDDTDSGLIDLCAADDPIEGCEGVAGTVTLAIVEPFAFVSDPAVSTAFRSCVEDTDIDADEFIIVIDANNFGSFTARYRIAGSGDEFVEVSGETDEAWRESFSPDFRYTNICLIGQRPTLEATPLELKVTGVGADDSGTAHFSEVVELPETDGARRRDGRPEVRVNAISASEFDVYVPVGDDERTEVTVVTRGEGGSIDCDAVPVAEGEGVVTARLPGAIDLDPAWHDQLFRLTVDDPGYLAICVRWTDTFTPPNELERASITLDIPTVTSTSLVLARYDQNPCLGGGCPSTPLAVWGIAELVGDTTCNGRLNQGSFVPSEPLEMCRISGLPDQIRLHTRAGFTRTDGGIRLDGVGETAAARFDPTCEETSCTTWFSVPVRAPGGLFEGNGGIVGRALFGIAVDGGTAGVAIGDEVPVRADDAALDGPRLDWSRVRVHLDPADPARSVIAQWTADRPVTVVAAAEATSIDRSDACPTVEASSPGPTTSGTITLSGLCPGTRHSINFTLTDEAGATTTYSSAPPRVRDGVGWIQRSQPIETEPLAITYDYELTFAEYERTTHDEITGKGVIPTRLLLQLPGHTAIDYTQYYFGEPYYGLDCSNPGHFNRSGSTTAELSGGTFRPGENDFVFETYRPIQVGLTDSHSSGSRICPTPYNQANHTPNVSDYACSVVIRGFTPSRIRPSSLATTDELDHMLAGGEATFVAVANSNCRQASMSTTFEVTLTVRLRPA